MAMPGQFSYLKLDEYVIMPNHIHGIIQIDKSTFSGDEISRANCGNLINRTNCGDAINRVSTFNPTAISTFNPNTFSSSNPNADSGLDSVNKRGGITGDKNPMLNDNLSRAIRWYKGRVSYETRKIHKDFCWQSRFYEHIIRDQRSLNAIRNYIKMNPEKWNEDEVNPRK